MVNPLLNPMVSFTLLKNVIFDPRRINRLNPDQMKKYRDKVFRKIVKYAYSVPLYHEKYKKADIHPSDIKGIDDIVKLPMVSKNDIRENFPDRILPINADKNKNYVICTGGTTGKSISIYTDFLTMGKAGGTIIRDLNQFNLNWKKVKMAHIGNFNPCRIDLVAQEHFDKYVNPHLLEDKRLNLDVSTPTIDLIKKLDDFKPDMILSYPAIF